jgi:hypothetical protein
MPRRAARKQSSIMRQGALWRSVHYCSLAGSVSNPHVPRRYSHAE